MPAVCSEVQLHFYAHVWDQGLGMRNGIYSIDMTRVAHHAISAEASSILQVRGKSPTGGTNNLMLESLKVTKGHLRVAFLKP